jgi:hypothetical protein
MIVLAFILGYMASGMMKQMCGPRLVEGLFGWHPLDYIDSYVDKQNAGRCSVPLDSAGNCPNSNNNNDGGAIIL